MRPCLLLPLFLAACSPPADAPDLSARDAAGRPWPRLLPLDTLLTAPDPRIGPEQEEADAARAARLRARAEALSAPAISPKDLDRIEDARPDGDDG